MNTDERRYFDALTERVLGAVISGLHPGCCRSLVVNFQKPKVEWKRIVYGFQSAEPLEAPSLAG